MTENCKHAKEIPLNPETQSQSPKIPILTDPKTCLVLSQPNLTLLPKNPPSVQFCKKKKTRKVVAVKRWFINQSTY